MIRRRYKIAGKVVEINSIYEDVHEYCSKYLTDEMPDYTVTIEDSDIDYEIEMSKKEKEYWFKQIRIVHNKNILYLANNYRNKELYKYVCNELKKDGYKISIKDKYIFKDIKTAVKSILNT